MKIRAITIGFKYPFYPEQESFSTKSSLNENFENFKNNECLECHDPHGGENEYIIQFGTCYQCHVDFKDKYNTLHGPVAGQFCSTCHSSHDKKYGKAFLLRSGQHICLFCHSIQILHNETHKEIENTECIECHNPHGGDDRYIFN